MNKLLFSLALCSVFAALNTEAAVSLIVSPEKPLQGQAILITIPTTADPKSVTSAFFDKTALQFFSHKGGIAALAAVDAKKKPGTYFIKIRFADDTTLEKEVLVASRNAETITLGVPEKLGGNTPAAQTKVVSNLSKENEIINRIYRSQKVFWTKSFGLPLKNAVVTDSFGTIRQTGPYSVTHLGTDFRANSGVPVGSINRGVVRAAKQLTVYGKTVVVDHGFGLASVYIHLSKINVNEGELVQKGQIVGLSGDTGYAEHPHLHMSVKLNGVSIDPITFLSLFE